MNIIDMRENLIKILKAATRFLQGKGGKWTITIKGYRTLASHGERHSVRLTTDGR